MKCQTYLSAIFCVIFICVVVMHASSEAHDSDKRAQLPIIHPGFQDIYYSVVMLIQMAIFGRCHSNPNVNMDEADLDYIEFYLCFVEGGNAIAEEYNFPTGDEFERESFLRSSNYPLYTCEFYQTIHNCLVPGLLPHLAGCLNDTTHALDKTHAGAKHLLEYLCENNATVFSEFYSHKSNVCGINAIRQAKEFFDRIFKMDEIKLFSTPESCREFAIARPRLRNLISSCNDPLPTIYINGLNRFYEISGCTNII